MRLAIVVAALALLGCLGDEGGQDDAPVCDALTAQAAWFLGCESEPPAAELDLLCRQFCGGMEVSCTPGRTTQGFGGQCPPECQNLLDADCR
jgi:hypothetical protein